MYPPNQSHTAVEELGGELLEGSGFESEDSDAEFKLDERLAEEDDL